MAAKEEMYVDAPACTEAYVKAFTEMLMKTHPKVRIVLVITAEENGVEDCLTKLSARGKCVPPEAMIEVMEATLEKLKAEAAEGTTNADYDFLALS